MVLEVVVDGMAATVLALDDMVELNLYLMVCYRGILGTLVSVPLLLDCVE